MRRCRPVRAAGDETQMGTGQAHGKFRQSTERCGRRRRSRTLMRGRRLDLTGPLPTGPGHDQQGDRHRPTAPGDEVAERHGRRPTDLDGAAHRRSHDGVGDECGDVLGGDRPQRRRRDADRVAVGRCVGDAAEELEELPSSGAVWGGPTSDCTAPAAGSSGSGASGAARSSAGDQGVDLLRLGGAQREAVLKAAATGSRQGPNQTSAKPGD
jgi:hypothetical protein